MQESRIDRWHTHKLHGKLYTFMFQKAVSATQFALGARLESVGLSWGPVKANLEGLPTSIPRGHCITYMKYLMNGLLTSARLRFLPDSVVSDCPFCGASAGDNRRHWVDCPVLRSAYNAPQCSSTVEHCGAQRSAAEHC